MTEKRSVGTRIFLRVTEPLAWLFERLGIRGADEHCDWCHVPLPIGTAWLLESHRLCDACAAKARRRVARAVCVFLGFGVATIGIAGFVLVRALLQHLRLGAFDVMFLAAFALFPFLVLRYGLWQMKQQNRLGHSTEQLLAALSAVEPPGEQRGGDARPPS